MKIAYLAWGSLLWNHNKLKINKWSKTNIQLPLNFSRVSDQGKGRLTLVIDKENGINNPIYYAITNYTDLNKAINNLRMREKTNKNYIGFINLKDNTSRTNLLNENDIINIKHFAKEKNIDAIVWTDIPPNFQEIFNKKFTKDLALNYIDSKIDDTKTYNKIIEYIFLSKVYGKINTPLSKYVINKLLCNL